MVGWRQGAFGAAPAWTERDSTLYRAGRKGGRRGAVPEGLRARGTGVRRLGPPGRPRAGCESFRKGCMELQERVSRERWRRKRERHRPHADSGDAGGGGVREGVRARSGEPEAVQEAGPGVGKRQGGGGCGAGRAHAQGGFQAAGRAFCPLEAKSSSCGKPSSLDRFRQKPARAAGIPPAFPGLRAEGPGQAESPAPCGTGLFVFTPLDMWKAMLGGGVPGRTCAGMSGSGEARGAGAVRRLAPAPRNVQRALSSDALGWKFCSAGAPAMAPQPEASGLRRAENVPLPGASRLRHGRDAQRHGGRLRESGGKGARRDARFCP